MEEDDDDADLKRLMNQAQAMLNISGNPSSSEDTSPDKGNDPRVMDVVTEVDMGRVVGTSVSADPNDERRWDSYFGYVIESWWNRQRAISYLEGLFLGLLRDMERSTRILNDREIEGKHKSRIQKGTGRKRSLDDGEDGSDDEPGEDGGGTRRVIGGEQVGITLRLKSRTTG
jgi:hypothetical protein